MEKVRNVCLSLGPVLQGEAEIHGLQCGTCDQCYRGAVSRDPTILHGWHPSLAEGNGSSDCLKWMGWAWKGGKRTVCDGRATGMGWSCMGGQMRNRVISL